MTAADKLAKPVVRKTDYDHLQFAALFMSNYAEEKAEGSRDDQKYAALLMRTARRLRSIARAVRESQ
jgi:hypothetical protein